MAESHPALNASTLRNIAAQNDLECFLKTFSPFAENRDKMGDLRCQLKFTTKHKISSMKNWQSAASHLNGLNMTVNRSAL